MPYLIWIHLSASFLSYILTLTMANPGFLEEKANNKKLFRQQVGLWYTQLCHQGCSSCSKHAPLRVWLFSLCIPGDDDFLTEPSFQICRLILIDCLFEMWETCRGGKLDQQGHRHKSDSGDLWNYKDEKQQQRNRIDNLRQQYI